MTRFLTVISWGVLLLCAMQAPQAAAAPPTDQLLPQSTKAYLSIPDVQDFRQRWRQTQLGQLAADPVMQPFTQDLQRQFRAKLFSRSVSLALTGDELLGACGGELCIAGVQAGGDAKGHASVLIVDVTGHRAQAEALLAKFAEELTRQNARRTVKKVAGQELVMHEVPRQRGAVEAEKVIRFLAHDVLVIGNHEATCVEILERLVGSRKDSTLATLASYRHIMDRAAAEAGDMAPQVRWYVDPFGYAQVLRAANVGPKKRRKDMLAILKSEGFDAIQAVGGYVHLATDEHEMLHRTLVYAPAVEATPQRYRLAARMLNFPNSSEWDWNTWLPRDLATTIRFNCEIEPAFEHAKTLVDAVAGDEGFFEDLLSSIKEDPNGPQIDVRADFVRHLGNRVTVLSDYVYPVSPKSERMLVAIEVTDEEAVRKTIQKTLESDPEARRLEVEGYAVWEILDQDDKQSPDLDLGLDGIDPIGEAPAAEEEEERLLRNSALTVAQGHLMISTHVDLLQRLMQTRPDHDQITRCEDFRLVNEQLQKIGAGEDSVRSFSRTDEEYRPTYELIRQGKMPESESLLGKLLNRLLGSDDVDVLREQKIDGSQLPDYETVRRYLGPAGLFVRSEDDGWYASGVLLNKQASYPEGVLQPAVAVQAAEATSGGNKR